MLLLWDIDEGFAQIDKYLDRSENDIVMGGFMALGLVNTGIVNEQEKVQYIVLAPAILCSHGDRHAFVMPS